jgi:hypothetical protein
MGPMTELFGVSSRSTQAFSTRMHRVHTLCYDESRITPHRWVKFGRAMCTPGCFVLRTGTRPPIVRSRHHAYYISARRRKFAAAPHDAKNPSPGVPVFSVCFASLQSWFALQAIYGSHKYVGSKASSNESKLS